LASGAATPEEAEKFNKNWNDAALFLLKNPVKGLFTVRVVE